MAGQSRNGRSSGGGPATPDRPGGRGPGARGAGARRAVAPETGVRAAVVRRTGPVLVLLHRAPRWVPFCLVFGLVVAGALLPEPAGGVALLVLALLLGWLLLLAWPALSGGGRAVRSLALLLVLGLAATRLT